MRPCQLESGRQRHISPEDVSSLSFVWFFLLLALIEANSFFPEVERQNEVIRKGPPFTSYDRFRETNSQVQLLGSFHGTFVFIHQRRGEIQLHLQHHNFISISFISEIQRDTKGRSLQTRQRRDKCSAFQNNDQHICFDEDEFHTHFHIVDCRCVAQPLLDF